MSKDSHAAMHAEHRQWQSDVAAARDDVDQWKTELKTAQTLGEVGLRKHLAALEQHEHAAGEIEREVAEHEHFLAERERLGHHESTAAEKPMNDAHLQRADEVRRLRANHEELKRRHHTIIAYLAALNAVLDLQSSAS